MLHGTVPVIAEAGSASPRHTSRTESQSRMQGHGPAGCLDGAMHAVSQGSRAGMSLTLSDTVLDSQC